MSDFRASSPSVENLRGTHRVFELAHVSPSVWYFAAPDGWHDAEHSTYRMCDSSGPLMRGLGVTRAHPEQPDWWQARYYGVPVAIARDWLDGTYALVLPASDVDFDVLMRKKLQLHLKSQTLSYVSANPRDPIDRAIVQHCGLDKVVWMQFNGTGRRPGGTGYWPIERITHLAEHLLGRQPDASDLQAAIESADLAFR